MSRRRVVVAGCGNPFRGDDQVGLAVAERLAGRREPGLRVVSAAGDVTGVLDAFLSAVVDEAILVDAVHAPLPAGTVIRSDADAATDFGRHAGSSTHAFGVPELLDIAGVLGCLPRRVVIYGVVGSAFALGQPMSPAVAAQVDHVAALVSREATWALRSDSAAAAAGGAGWEGVVGCTSGH
ncbi:hydrogenase maturation protease [Acidothermus cellulolyticus 11B]|uniref:Hydrogenase maturation protease n=1 Tax=Acidothermus cellulolyticus (strain ATCC 43068 / DSM 8971 / 11B) TaxID=351607 RepID=A0LTN3_ACIC1|nr:hydrogenase maturation protease [Acidothermus cellulolyticus]ABK52793.1 hydrogenase maturation protease [Acidothermus cellulolyticus 11B]